MEKLKIMIELRIKRIKFNREETFVKFAECFPMNGKAVFILLYYLKN